MPHFFKVPGIVFALAAGGAFVGGFFLASAVLGGDSPSGAEYSRPKDPGTPEQRSLKPTDAGFDEFLTEFADFPIYWAGDELDGLSLDYVARFVRSPDRGLTENKVMFFYGDCVFKEVPADGGCSRPLTIVVEPYCLVPPGMIAPEAATSGMTKVREGADAMMVGGGLRIWTGGATIKIYAATPGLLDEAVAALVSPNNLGPDDPGYDLPPPDSDCSTYQNIPHPALER